MKDNSSGVSRRASRDAGTSTRSGSARSLRLPFPGRDGVGQLPGRRDPSIQELTGQHAKLHLRHVQPTAMLRRVMELQLPRDPPRLFRRERLVQRPQYVGVEVVQYHPDRLRLRKVDIHEVASSVGRIPGSRAAPSIRRSTPRPPWRRHGRPTSGPSTPRALRGRPGRPTRQSGPPVCRPAWPGRHCGACPRGPPPAPHGRNACGGVRRWNDRQDRV